MSQGSRAKNLEVVIEGKRCRRNRKDLTATQESPGVDSHVEEPDKPPLSDGQSQRVVDPVQPGQLQDDP